MKARIRRSIRQSWGILPLKESFIAEYLRATETGDPGKAHIYAEALRRDFNIDVNQLKRRSNMRYEELKEETQTKVQQIEQEFGLSRDMAIIAATHPGTDTAEQMARAMGTKGQGSNANQGNENKAQAQQNEARIADLKGQYKTAMQAGRVADAISLKNTLFNSYGVHVN